MQTPSRREFHKQALGSLLTFSLLETLFQHDLFAGEVKPLTTRWLADVHQLGLDLKDEKLQQTEWQTKIEELFAKVDLADLLKLIDFDKLTKDIKLVDEGALSLRFKFPEVEGLPKSLVFGKQIFALKRDRSVVPHGHNNMATAFLILKGDLQGRHYDRVADEPEHFLIKPTIDRAFKPGECSTVSDYKDNIHWFKALTGPAYIFNLHVLDVAPGSQKPTGRLYVDPKGEKVEGGLIRAKRIEYEEANMLYG
ncbi:MAG TPA: hypothetical protein VMV69_11635 [Pirellulales bacterium]|nr:hypothetical protein [Pirellulales bacterium]